MSAVGRRAKKVSKFHEGFSVFAWRFGETESCLINIIKESQQKDERLRMVKRGSSMVENGK